ncbi:MAG: DUF5060 domain-containing protein, partial [Lentisphaerae bacterium]
MNYSSLTTLLFIFIFYLSSPLWPAGEQKEKMNNSGHYMWRFVTPPTAMIRQRAVPADWSRFTQVELPWQRLSPPPATDVYACFFIETSDHLWFESTIKEDFSEKEGKFILSLNPDKGDWIGGGHRRPFSSDILKRVAWWGISVFTRQPERIILQSSGLKLIRRSGAVHPRWTFAGAFLSGSPSHPVFHARVRMDWPGVDPYDVNLKGTLYLRPWGKTEAQAQTFEADFYFRQNFTWLGSPGLSGPRLVPYDAPYWQADLPELPPGRWQIEIRFLHGERLCFQYRHPEAFDFRSPEKASYTSVVPPAVPSGDSGLPPALYRFNVPRANRPLYRFRFNGERTIIQPVTGTDPVNRRELWHVQLDWTPAWDGYLGPGNFNQRIAALFEMELEQMGSAQLARPLVLFSEDELDDQGTFNWRDHPWNAANGGPCRRPADVYLRPEFSRLMMRRAKYLLARFGHNPRIAGLYLDIRRTSPQIINTIQNLVYRLLTTFPNLKLYLDTPFLIPHQKNIVTLQEGFTWMRAAYALGRQTLSVSKGDGDEKKFITVKSKFPGVSAIGQNKLTWHFAGWDQLVVPIDCREIPNRTIKFQVFLRDGYGRTFQSRLYPLFAGEMNRVNLPIDDPATWQLLFCPPTIASSARSPYDFLNIHGCYFRFFCDEPGPARIKVGCPELWRRDLNQHQSPDKLLVLRKPPPDKVPAWSPFEVDFACPVIFANPYDPDDVKVDFVMQDTATGKKIVHPGFFYIPWQTVLENGREVLKLREQPYWKIRYTPPKPGQYHWKIVLTST